MNEVFAVAAPLLTVLRHGGVSTPRESQRGREVRSAGRRPAKSDTRPHGHKKSLPARPMTAPPPRPVTRRLDRAQMPAACSNGTLPFSPTGIQRHADASRQPCATCAPSDGQAAAPLRRRTSSRRGDQVRVSHLSICADLWGGSSGSRPPELRSNLRLPPVRGTQQRGMERGGRRGRSTLGPRSAWPPSSRCRSVAVTLHRGGFGNNHNVQPGGGQMAAAPPTRSGLAYGGALQWVTV